MYKGAEQSTQSGSRFQTEIGQNKPTIWWRTTGPLLALMVLLANFFTAFARNTAGGAVVSAAQAAAQIATPTSGHSLLPEETAQPADSGKYPGDQPQGWSGLEAQIPPSAALPDMQTLQLSDIRLVIDPVTGERLLRFTNRIINSGTGPAELRGQHDPQTNEIHVTQHIQNGSETVQVALDGKFYYDMHHAHFHWEGFTAYEIWSVVEQRVLDQQVVTNEKVGFCLYDTRRASSEWLEKYMEAGTQVPVNRAYQTCVISRQGISPGWMDEYLYDLPGQALNISELADGLYALRSVVDPYGSLHEANTENNTAVAYFSLRGSKLTLLEQKLGLDEYYAPAVKKKLDQLTGGK